MNLFGGLAGVAGRSLLGGGSSKRSGGTSMTGNVGTGNTVGNAAPSGISNLMNNNTGYYQEKLPSGYRAGKLQQFSPEAMDLYRSLFQHLGPESYLSQLAGGDQSFFDEIEAPAKAQFAGSLGNIASRFSQGGGGPGALSSRRSSGFQNATTAAASNFAQQLQAQRQGLQRQAIDDLMRLSGTLLNQRPYETFAYEKPQKQGWGGLIGAGIGGIGGGLIGGPAGAIGGAGLGYNIGSGFEGGKSANFDFSGLNLPNSWSGQFGGGGNMGPGISGLNQYQKSILNSAM
jgi:hypothetical protein